MPGIKLIIITFLVSAVLIGGLIFWQNSGSQNQNLNMNSKEIIDGPLIAEEQRIKNPIIENDMNPKALIKTNYGDIELELFADLMPITTDNFMALSESGFYNGTKFHRVIDGFMIQAGDPYSKGDDEGLYGRGGPDKNVPDEFIKGELLTNTRGTIAMANTGQPNSGGSQWFINTVDNTALDFDKEPLSSKHPVFGRVIKGMDVVDTISATPVKPISNIPIQAVIIESITIIR